ncbi:hypothetical protein PIB30_081790 [Stylosanthes scabra]|uniref:Putative plant transposon protein domain-containing protein n=1 Tax=Stylosanthes scabra TaxID=79078 RepID=A0ABU6ZQJ5_9FABA|nr:hypothetical protein [Stylosanthes scabra]
MTDEEFDAQRFKSAFHQQFYNSYVASKDIIPDTRFKLEEGEFPEIEQQIELRGWKRLAKPKLKVGQSIIREFYANAHTNPDSDEDQPHFHTFVRGEVVNFSMESIKAVLRLDEQLESDTNFRRRMIPANQELENVIQDLCVRGSTWELGARNNPLYLKRRDLRPLARGWHEFIIHNILPTSNQLEVTVKRAVLIHCIIHGQDVRVEKLIAEAMTGIVKDLHTSRHPLAFPNIIARLCDAAGISYRAPNSNEAMPKVRPITVAVIENIRYPPRHPPPPPPQPQQYFGEGENQEQLAYDAQMPQGYGWGQLQADMANLKTTQTEFYESILAQHASYGLRLRDIEVKQNDMWAEQKQAQIHKEFTNYKKNFSTHMGKINKNFEDQRVEIANINHNLLSHTVSLDAKSYYTCWGLQKMNPSLAPVPPTSITAMIKNNVQEDKSMFDGMLRPWPVGEPSTGDKGKAPVDKDAVRDPNVESDNE